MMFWLLLWKWLFIIGLIGFALLTVWVTIWGAKDIRSLLSTMSEKKD